MTENKELMNQYYGQELLKEQDQQKQKNTFNILQHNDHPNLFNLSDSKENLNQEIEIDQNNLEIINESREEDDSFLINNILKRKQPSQTTKYNTLTENFIDFAQKQEKSQSKKREKHLNSPENSVSANISSNRGIQGNNQWAKSKSRTPLGVKTDNSFINFQNLKFDENLLNYDSDEERIDLIQNLGKKFNEIDLNREDILQFAKNRKEAKKLIIKENQIKLKQLGNIMRNKVLYQVKEALEIMKDFDKIRKLQIDSLRSVLRYQSIKTYFTQLSSFFFQWKSISGRFDLIEEVQALEEELTLEKTKSILCQIVSKFDLKLVLQIKMQTLRSLEKNQQKIKQLKRVLKIHKRFNCVMALRQWKSTNQNRKIIWRSFRQVFKIMNRFQKKDVVEAFCRIKLYNQNHQNEFQSQENYESQRHLEETQSQQYENGQQEQPYSVSQRIVDNIEQSKSNNNTNQTSSQIIQGSGQNAIFNIKRFYQQTKEDPHSMRYIQRLVLSQPTIQLMQPLKLNSSRNKSIYDILKPQRKQVKPQSSSQVIEFDMNDSEKHLKDRLPLYLNQSALLQANQIEQESLIKLSPLKQKQRSYNQKINNISNILRNNNNTDILDEDDHLILSRLMQKYQRDVSQIQQTVSNNPLALYQQNSLNSNNTLNFNSQETLNSLIPGGTGSGNHKKINSMTYFDKGGYIQENLPENEKYTTINRFASNRDQHMRIGEDGELDHQPESLTDERHSFASPKSLQGLIIMKGGHQKNKHSHAFNDHKDVSISVSKIEEEIEEYNQSRVDIQEFQNDEEDAEYQEQQYDNEGNEIYGETKRKKDFSFSIEKDRDNLYSQNPYMIEQAKLRKRKDGGSRNYYNNQMKSKQMREKMALNELTSVLNQQQYQHFQLRQSDLQTVGGVQGGVEPIGGTMMSINPQLEQETANFNKGDWFQRSPMQSTFQAPQQFQGQRPITRTSNTPKQNKYHSSTELSNGHAQAQSNSQRPSIIGGRSPREEFKHHNEFFEDLQPFQGNEKSLRNHFLSGDYQTNYNDSPDNEKLLHSHYANFSNEFISPDRKSKYKNQLSTTLRKINTTNQGTPNMGGGQGNVSNILDISGATTFAQQSAFEVFKSKVNDNSTQRRQQSSDMYYIKRMPQSVHMSPNKSFVKRRESDALDNNMFSKGFQSNQVSIKRVKHSKQFSSELTAQNLAALNEIEQELPTDDKQLYISNSESNQNDDIFPRQALIRPDRHKESQHLEYAEPMEMMSSHANSISNNKFLHHSRRSSVKSGKGVAGVLLQQQQPFTYIKESINPNQMNMIDEEDQDMTLKQSPREGLQLFCESDQKFQGKVIKMTSKMEYDDFDDVPVPVLHFDVNQQDQEEDLDLINGQNIIHQQQEEHIDYFSENNDSLIKLKRVRVPSDFDENLITLRDSLNANNAVKNYMMMSQNSNLSNHFQKRTLSHNDLVQLGTVNYQGTMQQQPTLQAQMTSQVQGSLLGQRSHSIQVIDQVNSQNNQQFLTSSTNQSQKAKILSSNGQKMQNKFLDAFKQYEAEKVKEKNNDPQKAITSLNQSYSNENHISSQSLILPQILPMSYFTQNGHVSYQQLDENTYEIDDFPIVNYNTSQLFNINNNPISLIEERNVIKVDEEIKEIDGEEEESFIFSNNNINHQNYSNIVNNQAKRKIDRRISIIDSQFPLELLQQQINNQNESSLEDESRNTIKINMKQNDISLGLSNSHIMLLSPKTDQSKNSIQDQKNKNSAHRRQPREVMINLDIFGSQNQKDKNSQEKSKAKPQTQNVPSMQKIINDSKNNKKSNVTPRNNNKPPLKTTNVTPQNANNKLKQETAKALVSRNLKKNRSIITNANQIQTDTSQISGIGNNSTLGTSAILTNSSRSKSKEKSMMYSSKGGPTIANTTSGQKTRRTMINNNMQL